MNERFKIAFIEEAEKEYKKLDGSPKKFVEVALAKLKYNADTMGDNLHNKNGLNLAGCRYLKFNKIGIRLVYRIVGDNAEIVEIITIGKRADLEVYEIASQRFKSLKE